MEIEQNFVGATDEFLVRYPETSQSYEGKTATVDGKSRTVAEIEVGEAFTTIRLKGPEEAP